MEILRLIVGAPLNRLHHHHNDTEHDYNESIDVLTKNCFGNYDTIACIRGTVLCFLSAVTGILCAGRIITLHLAGHPNCYQYGVFYLAVIQCMLGFYNETEAKTAEWVVGWNVHAELACAYLRAMQLLIICHFYLTMAFRVLRKSESVCARLSASALSMFLVYFTSFIIMGYVFANSPWFDCYANYWLFVCAGQLVLIQILVAAAVLIMCRVNAVTAQESLKRSQKRGLLFLIVVFELSALVSISYHLTLFFLANEDISCSGVFVSNLLTLKFDLREIGVLLLVLLCIQLHNQAVYTPVRITHELFVSLLPIWIMLYVFQPVKRSVSSDQQVLISATQSSQEGSLLDPSFLPPSPSFRQMRRRRSISYSPSSTLLPDAVPYRRLIRAQRRSRQRHSGKPISMKRSSSAPSVLRKLPTPPLATIPEETSSTHSSETSVQNSPQRPSSLYLHGNVEQAIEQRSSDMFENVVVSM